MSRKVRTSVANGWLLSCAELSTSPRSLYSVLRRISSSPSLRTSLFVEISSFLYRGPSNPLLELLSASIPEAYVV